MQRLLPVVSAAALRESTTTHMRDDDRLGIETTFNNNTSSSSSWMTGGKENDDDGGDAGYKPIQRVRNGPTTKGMDRRDSTRLALSPLMNANEETRASRSRGATTTTTTPLRRARSLMAEAAAKTTTTTRELGEGTRANRGDDGYAAAIQIIKEKFETRERELVRFMRDMAGRADAQSEELRDALDALAAAEEEHEKTLKEIADARASERDALEYSILLENKERLAERDKAAALASRLADRDEEISALNDEIHRLTERLSSMDRAESERKKQPQAASAAARYAVANLRSEIRDLLRDELRAEIAAEIVASAGNVPKR